MTQQSFRDWPDLFVLKQFLEPPVCEAIVADIKAAEGSATSLNCFLVQVTIRCPASKAS